MRMGGQCHTLPGKTQYQLYEGLWPQGWSGQARKISLPLGFNPQSVQPVVSQFNLHVCPHIFFLAVFNYHTASENMQVDGQGDVQTDSWMQHR